MTGGRNHPPNSRVVSVLGATEENRTCEGTGEFFDVFAKVQILGQLAPRGGKPSDDVLVTPAAEGDSHGLQPQRL